MAEITTQAVPSAAFVRVGIEAHVHVMAISTLECLLRRGDFNTTVDETTVVTQIIVAIDPLTSEPRNILCHLDIAAAHIAAYAGLRIRKAAELSVGRLENPQHTMTLRAAQIWDLLAWCLLLFALRDHNRLGLFIFISFCSYA